MCHLPPTLSIEQLAYASLILDIDPDIKLIDLLTMLLDAEEHNKEPHKEDTDETIIR